MRKPVLDTLGLSKRSAYETALGARLKVTGKIRLRDRWGYLECIYIEPIRAREPLGNGSVVLEFNSFIKVLRCTGGGNGCLGDFNVMDGVKQGVVPADPEWQAAVLPLVFPGKRIMRHCGCVGKLPTIEEMAEREAALGSTETYGVLLGVWIPVTLWGALQQYAEMEHYHLSEVYRSCITCGLDSIEGDGWILRHLPIRGELRKLVKIRMSERMHNQVIGCARDEGRTISACVIALIGLGLDELQKEAQDED